MTGTNLYRTEIPQICTEKQIDIELINTAKWDNIDNIPYKKEIILQRGNTTWKKLI